MDANVGLVRTRTTLCDVKFADCGDESAKAGHVQSDQPGRTIGGILANLKIERIVQAAAQWIAEDHQRTAHASNGVGDGLAERIVNAVPTAAYLQSLRAGGGRAVSDCERNAILNPGGMISTEVRVVV